jgi:hypothetical protein
VPSSLIFLEADDSTVIYLLKIRTTELGKRPLLVNGSDITLVARQRLGKHVPAATDKHAAVEVLLEKVFCTRSMQRDYKEDKWRNRFSSVRESVKKRGSWKGKRLREDLSTEAEESPLREAATRERLLKTQQVVKVLAGSVVICELWRLVVRLKLLVVPSSMYKWSINLISNPKRRL